MKCGSEALESAKALLDDALRRQPDVDAAAPSARAALDEVLVCTCLDRGRVDDEGTRIHAAVAEATDNPGRTVYVDEGRQA